MTDLNHWKQYAELIQQFERRLHSDTELQDYIRGAYPDSSIQIIIMFHFCSATMH